MTDNSRFGCFYLSNQSTYWSNWVEKRLYISLSISRRKKFPEILMISREAAWRIFEANEWATKLLFLSCIGRNWWKYCLIWFGNLNSHSVSLPMMNNNLTIYFLFFCPPTLMPISWHSLKAKPAKGNWAISSDGQLLSTHDYRRNIPPNSGWKHLSAQSSELLC